MLTCWSWRRPVWTTTFCSWTGKTRPSGPRTRRGETFKDEPQCGAPGPCPTAGYQDDMVGLLKEEGTVTAR